MTDTIKMHLAGLNCGSCVGRAEKALNAATGVVAASVNLATETATVQFAADQTTPAALAKAVTDAGYPATPHARVMQQDTTKAGEAAALSSRFFTALILTLPVFIIEMGGHLFPAMHHWVMNTIGMQTSWVIQFILITAVLVWPGGDFFAKGIPSLIKGAPDMNALVALGTSAAWAFSTVATFAPQLLPAGTLAVYFEAAGVIVTLILLGRWLELRAKGRTGEAIRKLVSLQPQTATILRDGVPATIAITDVVAGDTLRVKPGERIALDGVVVDGQSHVDESMITGEAVPVRKSAGLAVTGGTVNGAGAFSFKVTKTGEDTTLSQIIRMVEDAQGAKLPIQDLVNKITMWFVPAVLVIAAVTIIAWLVFGPDPALGLALVSGVAVLIVACPCAMGLATPTSIMVGTGRAAEMGVLFRRGDALQALQDADIVAFDKTGTLTAGRPELTIFKVAEDFDENDVLKWVASAEASSEHPIASAIVRAAQARQLVMLPVSDFKTVTGFGIKATVAGKSIMVGADRMMTAENIGLDAFGAVANDIGQTGATPFFAAVDGQIVAVIGVSDPVKDTSHATVAQLHKMGKTVAMVTGDNEATAQAIAAQLNIDHVVAGVLPQGKVAALQDLRADGATLAFVGDGINDAPALATADVGIAIGTGTDVAIESADVVLMSGDLSGVLNAFTISAATMRNIKQNLFWAFAYNTALIPVAAGILAIFGGPQLSPMFAAGAMALSSVFVLSNALRLRWIGGAA